MIITDDLPPSPVPKSPTGHTTITSPSIRSASDIHTPFLPLVPPPTYTDSLRGPRREMAEPAGQRFFRAFLYAAGVYVLFGILFSNAVYIGHVNYHLDPGSVEPLVADGSPISCHLPYQHFESRGTEALPWVGEVVLAGPVDSPLGQGETFAALNPPYWSRTDFKLPADAPSHFFFSRGSSAAGTIKIKVAENDDEDVHGSVITRYWSQEARDESNLCTLKKEDGSYGFGIYTPSREPPVKRQDWLHFEVTITVPPRLSGSLFTDYNIFAHDIGDLSTLSLQEVNFKSTNAMVSVESLNAQIAKVETVNSQITGFFNVTKSVHIQTVNALIDVQILASNKDYKDPADIFIQTANAPLTANITLRSAESDLVYTRAEVGFKIKALTANSPLRLDLHDAPIDSHIDLDASTSNSPADVSLAPAFEGKIEMTTSRWFQLVVQNHVSPDPAGRDRRRVFAAGRSEPGHIEGRVWWAPGDESDLPSSAIVRTTNGHGYIRLL